MKRIYGFTLVELLLTLAVFAILAGLAIPGFKSIVQNTRLQGASVNLVTALNLARSEAIKLGQTVNIQATDGSNWANGITVIPANSATTLRTLAPFAHGITATTGPTTVTSISYLPSGLTTLANNEIFYICDSTRSGETGRSISVSLTGSLLNTTYTCN